MADYNPIRSVDGKAIKCPSGYKYSLNDISASDAGRTEDTNMDKKRIGQCVKLEMEWQNVSIEDAAAIIQAFNPEYVKICYLDARQVNFTQVISLHSFTIPAREYGAAFHSTQ